MRARHALHPFARLPITEANGRTAASPRRAFLVCSGSRRRVPVPEGTPQPSWVFPRLSGGFWQGSCAQAMLTTLSLLVWSRIHPQGLQKPRGVHSSSAQVGAHALCTSQRQTGLGRRLQAHPTALAWVFFPHNERGSPGLPPIQPHRFSL